MITLILTSTCPHCKDRHILKIKRTDNGNFQKKVDCPKCEDSYSWAIGINKKTRDVIKRVHGGRA